VNNIIISQGYFCGDPSCCVIPNVKVNDIEVDFDDIEIVEDIIKAALKDFDNYNIIAKRDV
tara:strand:+ start:739 stop:921 length:183 start_codon:yes stop_codon:yes gene_type:complete